MTSHASPEFWKAYRQLPRSVQRHADQAFALFDENPRHPSLEFKRLRTSKPVFSARVGIHHRAIAIRTNDELIWFWIGSHAEYDALLRRL